MSHHRHHPDPDKPELDAILRREDAILEEVEEVERADRKILRDDREILHRLEEIEHELHHLPHPHSVTGFTDIKEIPPMVPLAAGQTATFATTPIPDGTAPDSTKLVWASSHPDVAPVVVNPTDASGLSAQVTFASTTPEGLTFILTVSYTNADGVAVSKANTFTTVAAPPADITGFTDIVQVA